MSKKEEKMEDGFTKGVLNSEWKKDGLYEKPTIVAEVSLEKEVYDRVKLLAGFKSNEKVSAKTVLQSVIKQVTGKSPSNFIVLKH